MFLGIQSQNTDQQDIDKKHEQSKISKHEYRKMILSENTDISGTITVCKQFAGVPRTAALESNRFKESTGLNFGQLNTSFEFDGEITLENLEIRKKNYKSFSFLFE